MADRVALQGFLDKWRTREPEMALVEPFCPASGRSLFCAWGALSAELVECTFELSDQGVARTKLAWWTEDLGAGADGRHPLTRALMAEAAAASLTPAHWRSLALAAHALLGSSHRPPSLDKALEELLPLASALAEIESLIFSAAVDPLAGALHLQLQRTLRGFRGEFPDRARLPTPWCDAAPAAGLREFAQALQARWRPPNRSSLQSTYHQLVDRGRLARLARTGDPIRAQRVPAWQGLWMGWRAARLALPVRKD
jgi:phytoene synthase